MSKKFFIDRKIIEQKNEFVVCCDDISANEKEEFQNLLSKSNSGTIIEISGCGEVNHASAKSTIEKLKIRLGVTYFPFLSASEEERINILLNYPGEEAYAVHPHDILFSQDAEAGFDPTSYTGARPCYAFKNEWLLPGVGGSEVAPIKLDVVTFPKGAMGLTGSPLTDEERARINSYKISRENKGFFVYRNGRLIRWGDDLGGIVNKDLLGFRARVELTTAHDDILHVDVSKQRLEMDDETRKNLDNLMRLPRKQAVSVFKICEDLLSKGTGEGVGFTETADSIPEEDPVEEINRPDPVAKKQRARKKEDESKDVVNKISDEEASAEKGPARSEEDVFMKVRYSDALHKMHLWNSQKDAIQGTYVIINRRHAFYQSIISNFNESSPERLALEAIIHCCAIGENMTYENLTEVEESNIQKVFERFYTVLSYNIGEWANGNHNIFDK